VPRRFQANTALEPLAKKSAKNNVLSLRGAKNIKSVEASFKSDSYTKFNLSSYGNSLGFPKNGVIGNGKKLVSSSHPKLLPFETIKQH
jgi:hypothetical protein